MKEKEIVQLKTRELYQLLLVKYVDLLLAHRLLCQVCNVAWYRSQIQAAKTPEGEALARWSVETARDELNRTLCAMNLCDLDKVLVRYIADHYEFDKD